MERPRIADWSELHCDSSLFSRGTPLRPEALFPLQQFRPNKTHQSPNRARRRSFQRPSTTLARSTPPAALRLQTLVLSFVFFSASHDDPHPRQRCAAGHPHRRDAGHLVWPAIAPRCHRTAAVVCASAAANSHACAAETSKEWRHQDEVLPEVVWNYTRYHWAEVYM